MQPSSLKFVITIILTGMKMVFHSHSHHSSLSLNNYHSSLSMNNYHSSLLVNNYHSCFSQHSLQEFFSQHSLYEFFSQYSLQQFFSHSDITVVFHSIVVFHMKQQKDNKMGDNHIYTSCFYYIKHPSPLAEQNTTYLFQVLMIQPANSTDKNWDLIKRFENFHQQTTW